MKKGIPINKKTRPLIAKALAAKRDAPAAADLSVVDKLARVIEGPLGPEPPGSPYTLAQLREVRWTRIGGQRQGYHRLRVKAVLRELVALGLIQDSEDYK